MNDKMRLVGHKMLPALLSHQQREEAAKRIRDVMAVWVKTPFEREGIARHAVRSSLCLGGASWARADQEAAKIVSMALAAMGAQRPSWDEGQPGYAVSEDYCQWCRGPMDLGAGARYCSAECAKSAFTHRELKYGGEATIAYFEAYKAMQRYANPKKECEECGREFHPRLEKNHTQRFCSNSCRSKHTMKTVKAKPVDIQCQVCGIAAQSHGMRVARYCGNRCEQIALRLKKGWVPVRISSQLFDLYITVPVNVARPRWLTPQRFDDLLAA